MEDVMSVNRRASAGETDRCGLLALGAEQNAFEWNPPKSATRVLSNVRDSSSAHSI